jgi:hypothetical protein
MIAVAFAAWAGPASAATRRIALLHALPELQRSIDLALIPWDVEVVPVEDAPPDTSAPAVGAEALELARRHDADAIAWLVPGSGGAVPTLWFFDAKSLSMQSEPLPALPSDDPAELAAVALSLKTLVRSAQWDPREPTAATPEVRRTGWETRIAIEAMDRIPWSGANAEPRAGLWASEWHGSQRFKLGAALGASAGLGVTFDDGTSHGSLRDIDVRAAVGARVRLVEHLELEPRLGASAHVERAQITTAPPAMSETVSHVNPSLDAGVFLDWAVTRAFAWSIGGEVLDSLRYQRWLLGSEVVFAPSPVWIQAGTSLAWSFQ